MSTVLIFKETTMIERLQFLALVNLHAELIPWSK